MRRLWPYLCASVPSSPVYVPRALHLICGLLLLCSLVFHSSYGLSEEKIAIEQTPPAVRNGAARFVAHYEPTKMLRLVLALTPPHMEDEEQFLRQLQDQNSPLFHQYLSEQEWNERFAPSAEDEQAVVAWAQRQGLTITQRYPNRLLVDVEGPSAAIEQALDVTINSYQVGEGLYFSNDRDPSIPSALANVVHSVLGLNSFDTMHTFSTYGKKPSYPDYSPGPAYAVGEHIQGKGNIRKLEPARKSTQKSSQPLYSYYGYDPTDLYSSDGYNFQALRSLGHCCNPLNNPQTSPPQSTIAIAIWGDFSNQDLQGFLANYSYLAHNVFRFFVHGTPRCCEPETTLDVEWATAMSNSFGSSASTAAVLVYEGTNGNNSTMLDVLNRVLTDNYARVLSMSWGGAENYEVPASDMESYHAVFNQLGGEGWTIVAASGDGGATSDCADHLSVFYPESDPDVTSVGGTTLYTDVGNYSSEAAWGGGPYGCSTNDGGSGGGCSAHFGAPAYQSGGTACSGNRRSVPDLALNADGLDTPQNFFYEGYMQPTGGTSIAAPEMAGFFAQENAYLLYIQSLVGHTCGSSGSAPCAPLGNANWDIYYEGLHQTAAHYPFYDIANGCNNNDITRQDHLSFFCAGHGFDRVTGWGSANMLQLAWTLNSFLADDDEGPNVSISGPPVNQWYMADQTLSWTLTDTSGNGHRPNGVAGSSLAWDADPGDPYHQPTPGNGNNYYGPQFFGETGSASGLSQLSQGCHTAFVRGWDNTGRSRRGSYGPLCYDVTPPVTTITIMGNGVWPVYTGPVQATISATDNASGVATTMYSLNQGPYQPYTGPILTYAPDSYCVQAYSVDIAGNVEWQQLQCWVITSNQKYLLQISKRGTGTGTVTSSDGAINCGGTCSANYWDGQPVTLTAAPDPGFVFAGWQGCDISFGYSCTLTMGAADRHAYAYFNVPVALQYIPVTPCRVADTRWPLGPLGGPSLAAGVSRDITIPQGGCNIPTTAAAYSLNLTAIPHGGLGLLTVWQTGYDRPWVSNMNSYDGRVKADAAIVPAGDDGAISVYASNAADLALDINGYFVLAPDPSALAFYPMAPCRVADTRWPHSPLGGPALPAQQQRDLPVLSSQCGIPATAQAYAMNFTAIPENEAPLWVFNAWPAGQPQPSTSTLNDPTGTAVANAAIVPAGTNGDIDVWANSGTDLVVDINGYFAPAGQGGLSLYANVPCRVLDTRNTTGAFDGDLQVNVVGAGCGVPQNAQAFVFNATVVPSQPLWLLTLWPDGGAQPNASTLNAWDSAVTSNMAVVMTNNGSIDAYAAGLTQLILDISSYFAP